jgi:hypothetical protein
MELDVRKYSPMPDSFTVAKTCDNCKYRGHEFCTLCQHFIGYVRVRDRTCDFWVAGEKYWKDMKSIEFKRDKENLIAKELS